MTNKAIAVLAILICEPGFAWQSSGRPAVPAKIQGAIGCIVSNDYVKRDLLELKLKPGDHAIVRFHKGSIRGTMPTPGLLNLVVYASDRRSAWLFFAAPEHGKFVVVPNGYRLIKKGQAWQASEGNGGLATYAAIGRFAARLETLPSYNAVLSEDRRSCYNESAK